MTHRVHDTLPDGFHYADRLQVAAFMATGSIDGASKVCLVAGDGPPRLATRLRPPRDNRYRGDYNEGWHAGRRLEPVDLNSRAFGDGYRDAAEGRMKWHLAHCPNHGDHAEGCGA